ncbi:hypothetical protein TRFO_22457 [Tritrichomonas foetus]|uniref:Ras-GAP domain-containing protein n=1 Tax=Tritrichomonas foetus TaxID=1144522 RepID=A0A1J4KD24_9EUKA|nr:hypothetical protein TRFO_22457 [Tritrichomonas foetus]|eukprot:OHT08874.1 hypothetical protein TRFO_22457 [Tritrichomonas foetus]
MSLGKNSLKFSLKPMKPVAAPISKEQVKKKVLSFDIDFSILPLYKYQMPQNIDLFWQKIGCTQSFKAVFMQLQQPLSPDVFKNLFNYGIANPSPFLRAFWDITSHMKYILPPVNLITFVSNPKLDMNQLFQLISPESRTLFVSTICLINSLMKGRDYRTQNELVYQFAKLLVPPQQSIFEAEKIELPVLMFAPAYSKEKNERHWIVLKKDLSMSIYQITEGSPIVCEIPPNGYTFDLTQGSLTTGDTSYLFMSQFGPDIFESARKDSSSLVFFIQSFKGIERYVYLNSLPIIIKEQFIAALGSPDFVLATAVVQSLVDTTDRKTSIYVFTALNETGTFAPFIRQAFMEDVRNIDNPSKLYRTSTIATCAASSIMGHFGSPLVLRIKEAIRQNTNNPANAMRMVMKICEKMPLLMNFIFCSAFKASRRKFSENLLPAVTVSSIFMLRYVMPQLINEPELKECGNHIAKGFLLRQDDPTVNDEKLMREACQFLIDITNLNGSAFQFESYDFALISQFLSNANDKIISHMKKLENSQNDPPLTWSVAEMIENCFVGCEHDFRTEIIAAELFDNNNQINTQPMSA